MLLPDPAQFDWLAWLPWLVGSLPVLGFLFPSCGCCIDCEFADRFTRDDASDPGGGWTVETGTWSIASDKLRNSDSSALVVWNTANSRDGGGPTKTHSASVLVQTSATGKKIRLCVGYLDADNYVAVQITSDNTSPFGTSYMSIVERIGGSETETKGKYITMALPSGLRQLAITYEPAPDQSYATVSAFFDAHTFGVTSNGAPFATIDMERIVAYTGGDQAAIAVTAGNGDVDFDDFAFPYIVTEGTPNTCGDYVIQGCGGLLTPYMDDSSCSDFKDKPFGVSTADGTKTIYRWPHNRNESRTRVTVSNLWVDADPTSQSATLITDYLDSDNYHYTVLEIDGVGHSATLTCYKMTGGAPTSVAGPVTSSFTGLTTAAFVTIWCMDNDDHRVIVGTVEGAVGGGSCVDNQTVILGDMDLSFTSTIHGGPWYGTDANYLIILHSTISGVTNLASPHDTTPPVICHECSDTDFILSPYG